MIQLIIIGSESEDLAGLWQVEARLAQRLLARQLPEGVPVVKAAAADDPQRAILAAAGSLALEAAATVLFLPHEELLLAPSCLERLLAAHRRLGCPVCAHSNLQPPLDSPPDYLTLRGIERYAARLSPGETPIRWRGQLCLASVAQVRGATEEMAAVAVGNAYYHDFSGYRANRREELLPLLPENPGAVLDVGGGAGGFLTAIKERHPACRTVLVEMSPAACAEARKRVDHVCLGDFLQLPFEERFDCISFLDVIEHAAEPEAMLLKARRLLTPSGCLLVSIPNVGHWSVIADLLEGRWDYAPAGIHCITHLRFFTRRTIEALFAESGFAITRWEAASFPPPPWFDVGPIAASLAVDRENLATVAWHCVARPC